MKTGDLVMATRKSLDTAAYGDRNRYMGIFIKSDWDDEFGDKFVECFTGNRTGSFCSEHWDIEVLSENR